MNEGTQDRRRHTPHPARQRRRPRAAGRRAGFTLVEIMIVVMIIGVLLNMAAPAMIHARDSGQARGCIANLHNIMLAKEQWAFQSNIPASYGTPPLWSDLQAYVKPGTQPSCPTTSQPLNFGLIGDLPTCPYGGPTGLLHAIH